MLQSLSTRALDSLLLLPATLAICARKLSGTFSTSCDSSLLSASLLAFKAPSLRKSSSQLSRELNLASTREFIASHLQPLVFSGALRLRWDDRWWITVKCWDDDTLLSNVGTINDTLLSNDPRDGRRSHLRLQGLGTETSICRRLERDPDSMKLKKGSRQHETKENHKSFPK